MNNYYKSRIEGVGLDFEEFNKLILDLKERLAAGKLHVRYNRHWRRLEIIKKGWFTNKVLGSLPENGEWLEITGKGGYKVYLDAGDPAPVLKDYADEALKNYARSELKKVLG